MTKSNLVYVKHILDHIGYIESFVEGISEEQFKSDLEKEFAIIRGFEVIGEAAKKVDNDFRLKYSEIPWKKMAAFRDVLIHDYERLVSEMIWKTVKDDLPELKTKLLQLLKNES